MKTFPINFIVEKKKCVVIGGGEVAARKVIGLLEAGASVTVICRDPCDALAEIRNRKEAQIVVRDYLKGDLDDAALAIVATDDRRVNREVAAHAREAGVPVNVADDPEMCDFIMPSILRRGDMTIAVSTGGSSPALAAKVRSIIESVIGEEYGNLTAILGDIRDRLKNKGIAPAERKADWDKLIGSNILDLIKRGDEKGISKMIAEIFGETEPETKK